MEHHMCDSFYLFTVVDGITTCLDGWCYCHMADGIAIYRLECKADVIAFVVDGITMGSYLGLNSMLLISLVFQHINSLDENIKFTAETTKADGSMPFLDTLVTPKSDGCLENHSLQEAHSHQSIFAVGQPPCHNQQIQHYQHTITQGQKHLLQLTSTGRRTNKNTEGPSSLQIPRLGN